MKQDSAYQSNSSAISSSSYQTFQGEIVDLQRQNQFPFNCIGCVSGDIIQGTGVLISNKYLLTSAHNIILTNHQFGQIQIQKPSYFSLELGQENTAFNKQIKIANFRIPQEAEQIYRQMAQYPDQGPQWYQLWEKSLLYDYALLKLESGIELPQYPVLRRNFNRQGQMVTVYGYIPVNPQYQNNQQRILCFNSGLLLSRPTGGYYNIQTVQGQNGGPVVFIEEKNEGSNSICHVVGIHKGYDSILNSSTCTLITKEVIDRLSKWHEEMEKSQVVQPGNKRVRECQLFEQNPSESIMKLKRTQCISDSNVLKLKAAAQKQENRQISDSVISDIKFINDVLCNPEQIQLIFRASEHSFKAAAFHQFCDALSDTLVLVRTEYGKTLAGYSHYRWGSQQEEDKLKDASGCVTDDSRRAFLLQLDRKEKLLPQTDVGLICCQPASGPVFGHCSLYISDNCGKVASSTTAGIGARYNVDGPNKYQQNCQETSTVMSGATKGSYFRVTEYEVYKVTWTKYNQSKFDSMLKQSKLKIDTVKSNESPSS